MELLQRNNIMIDCKAKEKTAVIREIGQLLCTSGYVEKAYIDGMLQKETIFSTSIGNSIAIPHGVEGAKKYIKKSGFVVMVFPEGTDWGGDLVKVVIGIAGVGEEHLDILANIADKLSSEAAVEELAKKSVEEVYQLFSCM